MTAQRVLVTGGSRGLGRSIALAYSRLGSTVVATHRWGSVSQDEFEAPFRDLGLVPPRLVESDAADPEETRELFDSIAKEEGGLDVVISNVAFGKVVHELGDLRRNAFDLSVGYSAWPIVELVRAAEERLPSLPRYVIAVSSDGPSVCHPGYDLVGACKSVLETLCRYLAVRLRSRGVRVNAIRPGFLDTQSARDTFGPEALAQVEKHMPDLFLDPDQVAQVCVALTSGAMDAVTGQVLTVDAGWSLVSPIAYLTGTSPWGNGDET